MDRSSRFIEQQKSQDWFWLTLICLSCAVLMSDFPLEGIPDGYDVAQHLRFAASYYDAMMDGSFPPVWALPDNFGFGSVGIRFYPPLTDFLLAVAQVFTNDWYTSLWANSFFWLFPGSIGIYLWLREFRPRSLAAGAAILYALMPYHLLQIYRFQLYSEFAASAILPFCFLFATRLARNGRVSDLLSLSISCALILLIHIPSSIIAFAGLGLYSVLIIDWNTFPRSIAKFAAAVTLALVSTSFYLVRLATEVNWVRHSTEQYSVGFYDYRRHLFPIISNFGDNYYFHFMWLLDVSILITILLFLPLAYCLIWSKTFRLKDLDKKFLFAIIITGAFSIFMLSSASSFVWRAVGPLQKIQFPWRFMSLGSLMCTVAFSLAVPILLRRFSRFKRLIVYPTVAIIFGIVLFDLTQTIIMAGPLNHDRFYEKVVNIREEDGCPCWWPTGAKGEAFENKERVSSDGRKVEAITAWTPSHREFTIGGGESSIVRVATFYYPYWKIKLNGQPGELGPDTNGAITIPINGDITKVDLYFEEPSYYQLFKYLSGATWVLFVLAFIGVRMRRFSCANNSNFM